METKNNTPHNFSYFKAPITNVKPSRTTTILEVYNYIVGPQAKHHTKQLRAITDSKQARTYKAKHFDYVTFSGAFTQRGEKHLIQHSSLLCLDFDHIPKLEEFKHQLLGDDYFDTILLFRSPSGDGLKWIIEIDLSQAIHQTYFEVLKTYIKETYNIEVDKSCKDISRACFLCYDPNAYINQNNNTMNKKKNIPSDWLQKPSPSLNISPNPINQDDEIEKIISRIEKESVDISPTYEEWRNLGFALASTMGESGRDYYQRLSCFHHNYTAEDTDRQYTACLNHQGQGITIKTLFHLAKQAGVSLTSENQKHCKNRSLSQSNTSEERLQCRGKQIDNQSRPTIALKIQSQLPVLLQNILDNAISPEDADLLLFGSLTVFSACLPNIIGTYGGCDIYPNLFLFLTAGAGAGKGRLSLCRRLVAPIHNEILEINKEEVKLYNQELAQYNQYNQHKKESNLPPEEAKTKMLFIPANSSATAVFQVLNNNNGIGLFFETEADTLSQTFKSEHGNYSDALRKSFHHENISYLRRKENEYVTVENPRLSAVLSGTPKQVRHLITNTENGLFSRFMFYYMNTKLVWNNVFQIGLNNQSYNNTFDSLGEEFFNLHKRLKASKQVQFSLTAAQKEEFNEFFEELQINYYESHGIEFMATVRRLGLITYRILLILSALRLNEVKIISTKIICKSKDFKSALKIALTLISHAEDVFQIIPKISNFEVNTGSNAEKILKIVSNQFDRQQFIKKAATIKIAARTADRHLKNLCLKGDVVKRSQGNYEKKDQIISPIMELDLDDLF